MLQNRKSFGNGHPAAQTHPLALWVYISSLPLLLTLWAYPGQDMRVYWSAATALAKGQIPYLNFPLEYPPYAILTWMIPILGNNLPLFKLVFAVQILALDAYFKFFLLGKWQASGKTFASYVPFICFSISAIALRSLYLQRMDLVPAVLSVISMVAFFKARYVAAGVILSIAAGMKLFPVLFFFPLLALASKKNNTRNFINGIIIGASPILLSSPFVPWLKFLDMHLSRGLQVESTYASFIWLIGKGHPLDLQWIQTPFCHELSGEIVQHCLPYFQFTFITVTLASVFHVSYMLLMSSANEYSLPHIAKILLLVLFPFVLFNKVFSPQYLIWLNAIAAIAFSSRSDRWHLYLMTAATAVTALFYPSPEYHNGLTTFQSIVLASRNITLLAIWVVMYCNFIKEYKLMQSLRRA